MNDHEMNLSNLPNLSSCNLFSLVFCHGDKKLVEISFYCIMEIFHAQVPRQTKSMFVL